AASCRVSITHAYTRPSGSGAGSELEPVAERVVDEQPVDAGDPRVVLERGACPGEPLPDRAEIVGEAARARPPRRREPALAAEVALRAAHRDPPAAARAHPLRLRAPLGAEHCAVERARVVLPAAGNRDLDVVDAEDAHRVQVYHRSVAAQLEDTLVSGYV